MYTSNITFNEALKRLDLDPNLVARDSDFLTAYFEWTAARPETKERDNAWDRYCLLRDSHYSRRRVTMCYHPSYVKRRLG